MGTWGPGILRDDFVLDVMDAFNELLESGKSVTDISAALKKEFRDEIHDVDDGPKFWIALAWRQWNCGSLDQRVLKRVRDDFESGRSLSEWEESKFFAQRRAAIRRFISKISVPNPNSKRPDVKKSTPRNHKKKNLAATSFKPRRISSSELGDVIEIPLQKAGFAYGRVALDESFQVFDVVSKVHLSAQDACSHRVAFWSMFPFDASKSKVWKVIGRVPFAKKIDAVCPPMYIDSSDLIPGDYSIYYKEEIKSATKAQIRGMEEQIFYNTSGLEEMIAARLRR